MEGTLTESTSRMDKTFAFKGPADYTKILTEGSVEVANLANNHSRDYGEQSYTDTIAALDAAGIVNFGYMISNHHLILSAGLYDRDNPIRVLEHIRIRFCLILQNKTKSCNTVLQTDNIALSSYILDNDSC